MRPKTLLSNDGTPVTYRRFDGPAEAPPLILSGGLGGTHLVWTALTRELRGSHTIVIWDYPGLTAGSTLDPAKKVSVDWLADLQDQVIAKENLELPWLVGWSMGPQVAFAHALGSHREISGIVALCGVAGSPFSDDEDEPVASALGIRSSVPGAVDWITERVDRIDSLKTMLSRIEHPTRWAKRFGFVDPSVDELLFDAVIRDFINLDPITYNKYVHAAAIHPEPAGLADLSVPVAAFAGQRDRLVPAGMIESLVAAIPGAKYNEVRGATHFLPMEYPELVAMKIEDLIKNSASRP